MKTFFMWVGVAFCLIMIQGLIAKTDHAMGVLDAIAFVVWCVVGFFMAVRGIYRFTTKPPRGPGR